MSRTVAADGAGAAAGGRAIDGRGIFGAWVNFLRQADGLADSLLAVVQGLLWPAWMVYEGFRALAPERDAAG